MIRCIDLSVVVGSFWCSSVPRVAACASRSGQAPGSIGSGRACRRGPDGEPRSRARRRAIVRDPEVFLFDQRLRGARHRRRHPTDHAAPDRFRSATSRQQIRARVFRLMPARAILPSGPGGCDPAALVDPCGRGHEGANLPPRHDQRERRRHDRHDADGDAPPEPSARRGGRQPSAGPAPASGSGAVSTASGRWPNPGMISSIARMGAPSSPLRIWPSIRSIA